jgi:hypothetical protein
MLDKGNSETLLYSGLIDDCCGGGMPTIKEGPVSFIPVVVDGTGDACASRQGKTYVNLRDAPTEYLRLVRTNDCGSFGSLQVKSNEQKYQIEPVLSKNCREEPAGAEVTFSALQVSTTDQTYNADLPNPVSMTCTDSDGPTGDSYYSKSISFRNMKVEGFSLEEASFQMQLYSKDDSYKRIPATFSVANGVDFKN